MSPFLFGIITGFIILGVATSLLTTSLYQWIPTVEPYFKVVGAAYLLYLAWQIVFSKKQNHPNPDSQSSFFYGLFFQILNIKSILYFLTAMSTFILPYPDSQTAMLFSCVYLY
ncbi:LysE family translocator [Brevibacillus formosus]|nr:LysE family transporter [Brevibacillus formosus]MED1960428.1 LysE family transporter [Brevibacillus formosus]